jgi:hypothetical protein
MDAAENGTPRSFRWPRCASSAAETNDPKQRAMLLKLASEWQEDAKELLRVAESAPSGAPAPVRRNKR